MLLYVVKHALTSPAFLCLFVKVKDPSSIGEAVGSQVFQMLGRALFSVLESKREDFLFLTHFPHEITPFFLPPIVVESGLEFVMTLHFSLYKKKSPIFHMPVHVIVSL